MKQKEKEIQKALGLFKKYSVLGIVNVPSTIGVPFTMDIEAPTEDEARKEMRRRFKKMTPKERKAFVVEHTDEEVFCEMMPRPNDLYDEVITTRPDRFGKLYISDVFEEEEEEEYK
jgi:hypothetical protein